MDIERVSDRHINKLEQEVSQLLKTMRNAKLSHLPIYDDLYTLEQELAKARQRRFDSGNTEYQGY